MAKKTNAAMLASASGSNPRGAGILMHITSLPSSRGIGDIGAPALEFARFLHAGGQKYWQMLPLNPAGAAQSYSPYSSTASMASNPLLISAEGLVENGWLARKELSALRLPDTAWVNFKAVERRKSDILRKAFSVFARSHDSRFEKFVESESYWLRDFALFMLLKHLHQDRAWGDWANPYKRRDKKALQQLERQHSAFLQEIRWQQYAFHTQWQNLRSYCAERNISLVGDIPFYVGYDSCDVWANQDLFALDRTGKMTFVAGVPPDYFNADGQLWGMPVFNWQALRNSGYQWWIDRLKKNIEMFDLVRLDHFRAFAAFWQVGSREKTARKGKWVKGPGEDFFDAVHRHFSSLPFIAEDLGDIDEPVHRLREKYKLPGMKVLQFAFDDPAKSAYSPHNHSENFVVYTGTHDNNTTRGWFRKDANKKQKSSLSEYVGRPVTQQSVHLEMMRLAYSSVSRIAMIPMQDVLGLDEKSRMNTPASVGNNWMWRMREGQMNQKLEERLRRSVRIYNRI